MHCRDPVCTYCHNNGAGPGYDASERVLYFRTHTFGSSPFYEIRPGRTGTAKSEYAHSAG